MDTGWGGGDIYCGLANPWPVGLTSVGPLPLPSPSVVANSERPHRRQPTRLPRLWGSPGKNTGVGCCFLLQCMKVKSENEVAQLCPTLHDPMDCGPPGSSVHGIFQARVLEWGAIAFSLWAWGSFLWNEERGLAASPVPRLHPLAVCLALHGWCCWWYSGQGGCVQMNSNWALQASKSNS